MDKLKAIGVGLASLRDPGFDTTTPQGELVFHVLAAVGQFERELIRERIRAGLARAKRCPRKGKKRPGRPRRVRLDLDAARRMIAGGEAPGGGSPPAAGVAGGSPLPA